MAVSGVAAANTMLAFRTWRAGYCLEAVWQAYKRNGASTSKSAPTAYDGWLKSGGKHEGDRNPPAGVPVWFGPKASSRAGDVVISLGGGRVVATDWPHNGVINITTIDARQRQIGRPYLGWTEDILGAAIDFGQHSGGSTPAPPAPPSKKEYDTMIMHRDSERGSVFFVDELGADHILDYGSADIEFGEYVNAAQKAWETKGFTAREWDIVNAIANRRWATKRAEIVNETVAKLIPIIQKGQGVALDPELVKSAIKDALKDVEVDTTVDAATIDKIANTVLDKQHARLAE